MPEESPLTRSALYELIWSEPCARVANRLGLSDRGLGKLCARYKIPVPPRGWWARQQHGYKVTQPALPLLPTGANPTITVRRRPPAKPQPSLDDVPEIAFELRPENRIEVIAPPEKLHPFVTKTRSALRKA